MRTTLSLDPTVLSAARALSKAEHVSLGDAVSELARRGMQSPQEASSNAVANGGFPVLSGDPSHPVTDELVERYRDDEPDHHAA